MGWRVPWSVAPSASWRSSSPLALLLTGCIPAPPDPTEPPKPVPTRDARPVGVSAALHRRAGAGSRADPAPVDPVVDAHRRAARAPRPRRTAPVWSSSELSYDAEAEEFVDTPRRRARRSARRRGTPGRPRMDRVDALHVARRRGQRRPRVIRVLLRHERERRGSRIRSSATASRVSTTQGFRPGDDLRAFADELGEELARERLRRVPGGDGTRHRRARYDEWTDIVLGVRERERGRRSVGGTRTTDPAVTSVISAPWNFGIGHV